MSDNQFICEMCQKVFVHENSLQIHQSEGICEKSNNVQMIQEKMHLSENKKNYFKCHSCGKEFKFLSPFQKHQITHNVEKPFKCTICQQNFSRKHDLIVHQSRKICKKPLKNILEKTSLTDNKELPFKCETCGKEFKYLSKFEAHRRSHTGEKPFKCDNCQRGFSDKGNLKRHILTHKEDYPFKCKICSKVFTRQEHLSRHQKIHESPKSFQCDICQRCFLYKGSLKRHQKKHKTEKLYKCEKNKKSVTAFHRVKNHVQTNMEEEHCSLDNMEVLNKTSHDVVQKLKNDTIKYLPIESNLEGTSAMYSENNSFEYTYEQKNLVDNICGSFSNQSQHNLEEHSSNSHQNKLYIQIEEIPPFPISSNQTTINSEQMLINPSTDEVYNKDYSEIYTEMYLQRNENSTEEKD